MSSSKIFLENEIFSFWEEYHPMTTEMMTQNYNHPNEQTNSSMYNVDEDGYTEEEFNRYQNCLPVRDEPQEEEERQVEILTDEDREYLASFHRPELIQ